MVGADARVNTHQKFRKWLDSTFSDGTPTEDDWKSLLEEDHQICYGIAECEEEGILEEGLAQDDWQLQQAQLQSEEEQR